MDKEKSLEFLDRLCKGLAETFGRNCETLIHDMSHPNHPILRIYNNHVSGREIGSTKDIYGNETSDREIYLDSDFVNNLVITKSGKKVKSSTFHFKGNDYHFALGINYDFTEMYDFARVQNDFMKVDSDLLDAISEMGNVRLSTLFDASIEEIGKSVDEMTREDRMLLLKLLKDKNAFQFKKFVPYVSEKLKVSRYTIYKDLKEIES